MNECKPLGDGDVRPAGVAVPDHHHGMAVQIDPIKTTLTAPGIERLKLIYYEVLSSFAFTFDLRRYIMTCSGLCFKMGGAGVVAGAHNRSFSGLT